MGKALVAGAMAILLLCIAVLAFTGITGNFAAMKTAYPANYKAVIKEVKPVAPLPVVKELQPLQAIPTDEEQTAGEAYESAVEEPLPTAEAHGEPVTEEQAEAGSIEPVEEKATEEIIAGIPAIAEAEPAYSSALAMERLYEEEDIVKSREEEEAIAYGRILEIKPGVISIVSDSFRRIWGRVGGGSPAYGIGLSAEDMANPAIASADIAKYQRFQRSHPEIFREMVWADESRPNGGSIIYSREKMEMLAHYIALLETGQQFPFEAPPAGFDVPWGERRDSMRKFYTEEEALRMWIPHLAVSLYTEVNGLVPWSILPYTSEQRAFLLDARRFINYWALPEGPAYTFFLTWENGGGLTGITDWNAFYNFDFLRGNEMVRATQADSIYAFTQWIRENIYHEAASNAYAQHLAYGYNGSYPVDKVLNPPAGQKHWTQGCPGTSSLYSAMLKTINIPVSINLTLGGHRGPLFLTAGLALIHGDDPYGIMNRRGTQEVPVEDIFVSIGEFYAMNHAEPEPYDGTHTPTEADMAGYLNSKKHYQNAYEHMAYALLNKRAQDYLVYLPAGIINGTLEDWWGYEQWRPIFEADERQEMFEAMDAEILRIGEGDYRTGWRRICSGLIPRPGYC